ncbi:chaplin family protein [Streptomyces eurythermus]|uniref:chaplin family protein n=1 Tax=Streptomyces eurythermus TaxID=42237 RepID=UPI003675954A
MGMAVRARSARRQAVLVGTALGAVALSGTPAHANIVGVGNAAFGNSCANHGAVRASGATVAGTGTLSGNAIGLPLDLPRNECGNSGITCAAGGALQADAGVHETGSDE